MSEYFLSSSVSADRGCRTITKEDNKGMSLLGDYRVHSFTKNFSHKTLSYVNVEIYLS